jgi:nicotinamide riboside transporter PnuC
MTWIEPTGLAITIMAVIGVLLNNRRRRACFLLWLVTNGVTCGIHVTLGVWSLAGKDAIFFLLAIDGWFRWGRTR